MCKSILIAFAALLVALAPAHAGSIVSLDGPVAAIDVYSGGIDLGSCGYLLMQDGSVWKVVGRSAPLLSPVYIDLNPPLPVAVADIAWWSHRVFTTHIGDVWVQQWFEDEVPYHYEWVNLGPVPVGPVSAQPESVGSLKGSRVRRDR